MAMTMANVGHSDPDLAEILLCGLEVPQLCMLKVWWKLTDNWRSYGHLELVPTWVQVGQKVAMMAAIEPQLYWTLDRLLTK